MKTSRAMAKPTSTAEQGKKAEILASQYLENKGLKLITTNWRCKVGEIDLVMQDGSTRVLVEVRARRRTSYGQGLDTVAWQKQQKLIRTARYYQQKERYWGDIRFDVVSVLHQPGISPLIEHIPDAFRVG